MTEFTLHTTETSPSDSKPMLKESEDAFGMIPNLHAVMAESPQHLEAYKTLHALFENSSLSTAERNVVWLTVSAENNCHYCVPAHTAIAKSQNIDEDTIEALRSQRPLQDNKLEALRQTTLELLRKRGQLDDKSVQAFFDAGFSRANLLDVLVGVSQKTLSNYVNHIAQTPVDEPFEKFAWNQEALAE
ncbi:carboxymuconolactone decarboxylase family protein [Maricaulis sp. CAU 1757]